MAKTSKYKPVYRSEPKMQARSPPRPPAPSRRFKTLAAEKPPYLQERRANAPFILGLIGVIVGAISALSSLIAYFLYKSYGIQSLPKMLTSYGNLTSAFFVWSLISSIIGLILTIILILFLKKAYENPSKHNYLAFIILGILGFIFSLGLGAFLIVLAGIIGLVQINRSIA